MFLCDESSSLWLQVVNVVGSWCSIGKLLILYVTIFRKTNQFERKSIIAYAWKYSFEHEDAN